MENRNMLKALGKREKVTIVILLLTTLIHLISPARYLEGKLLILYRSYFSDICIPFTFYFVVSIAKKLKIPRSKIAYFCFVLGACILAEGGQYFGIPILGKTFDYLDFVAYSFGTLSALIIDTIFIKNEID